MTVVALLSVAPVIEGSMAEEVAKAVAALDDFDVSYETNPMGTVIEADSTDELFAAAQAAHDAVDGDRVSTFLKTFLTTFGRINPFPSFEGRVKESVLTNVTEGY